jgi:hypothetical protein
MKKTVLFVFNGNPMCFIHVLLNALEMKEKGNEVSIVIEGESVKLLPELVKPGNPLNGLWKKALDKDLVAGVCLACAKKLGTYDEAVSQGLALIDDMSGHASMAFWQEKGYEIITF